MSWSVLLDLSLIFHDGLYRRGQECSSGSDSTCWFYWMPWFFLNKTCVCRFVSFFRYAALYMCTHVCQCLCVPINPQVCFRWNESLWWVCVPRLSWCQNSVSTQWADKAHTPCRNKTETLLSPPSLSAFHQHSVSACHRRSGIMCLEMLHSLNLSNTVMHFATRPPSLLSVCLNTPLLPKHCV